MNDKSTNILLNVITEVCREIEKNPDDSIQDIWNEKLKEWNTGLWMNHHFVIQPEIKFPEMICHEIVGIQQQ